MTNIRKTHCPAFKAKVAIEAIKEQKTLAEIASTFSLHTTLIGRWKQEALTGLQTIFADKRKQQDKEHEELIASLYQEIGQQKYEIGWLKKKIGLLDH